MSDVSDEVSLEIRIRLRSRVFEVSELEVWRAGALWSCGWICGVVKDKGRLFQLPCVDLSV